MYKVLIVEDEIAVCRGSSILVDWEAVGFKIKGFCSDGTARCCVQHRYVDRCVVRENGDGDKLEQERMQWLRGVLRENPELLEELTNVVLTEKKEVV